MVLLVPGTGLTGEDSFPEGPFVQLLPTAGPGFDVCWVSPPNSQLGDAQINAEYVAHAIMVSQESPCLGTHPHAYVAESGASQQEWQGQDCGAQPGWRSQRALGNVSAVRGCCPCRKLTLLRTSIFWPSARRKVASFVGLAPDCEFW